jgi:hypothetical protein
VQTAVRHGRIAELVCRIDRAARDRAIAVVALKGVELHAIGVYRGGERPMCDIDLLVHPADIDATARMLESLGFCAAPSTWKHRTFVPQKSRPPRASLGEHADDDIKIDLHESVREALPAHTQDVTKRVMPLGPHPGLNRYPSAASLMIHLLLHAAGAIVLRNIRLLQLHDVALLSRRMTEADWDEMLGLSAADGGYWWAWPPLQLTNRYYPTLIPVRVRAHVEAICPRRLRSIGRSQTLSDVSLSHLPLRAFPGIEWSQSLSEAFGYVLQRVRPDRQTLEMRVELANARGVHASRWAELSQRRRILRWLTAPQSRTETLYTIRMALLGGAGPSREITS